MTTSATAVAAASPTETHPQAAAVLGPGAGGARAREVLGPGVLALVGRLHRAFEPRRRELLATRTERQAEIDAGALPRYLERDSEATLGDWRVAPIPADLSRRRVEITGPVNSAKMVIKMLSRNDQDDRADTAMLDFEDSMKPTWANVIDGYHNVRAAADGSLEYVKPAAGVAPEQRYALELDDMAGLMVRVRGLHLGETNLTVDGEAVSGGLLDLAVCLWHSGKTLLAQGKTPKYYVPKCEHYLEARWWNDLFCAVQEAAGLAAGSLRATFLIETLQAAFQMEEILYEIRQHAAGLNVGRWDKIFSDIKVLRMHPDRVMADRASIGLGRPWMRAYAERLVQICHRRGAFAIGGMAAFTPGKTGELRRLQTERVFEDKQLEASLGHDGCWVSHPYFIGVAMSAFERDNQLDAVDPEADLYPDLLPAATPPLTLEGLRTNVRVGIGYLKGWNEGLGCVAWDDLMEDLATLEISRAQTWQWLHHGVVLDDGTAVTRELVRRLFDEELARIHREVEAAVSGPPAEALKDAFTAAAADAVEIFTRPELTPFLAEASEPAA